ncbi:hypothetical protein HZB01_05450 [Candidatus Woesearchaeota archaeon]|nr:hypothetical protein [Candidatus Woesearchaeota archaeon]
MYTKKGMSIVIALMLLIVIAGCQIAPKPAAPSNNNTNVSIEDIGDVVKETPRNTTPANASTTGKKTSTSTTNKTEKVVETKDDKQSPYIIEVTENDLVSVKPKGSDPDGDKITFTFTKPLNASGEWQTKIGDAGKYTAKITAYDGQLTSTKEVVITVNPANRPPTMQKVADIKVKEGETATIKPEVSDPDGDQVTVTYGGWMTSSTKKTTSSDAGEYQVKVTATDGNSEVIQNIKVTVEDVNRPPTIEIMRNVTVIEGSKVTLTPKVADPDGDTVKITYGGNLTKNGVWETKKGEAGTYEIPLTASDGKTETKTSVVVTIKPLNRPPTIEMNSTVTVEEGDSVKLKPMVKDPEGDQVKTVYSGWMTSDTKVTDYNSAGTYAVKITATDSKGESTVKEVTVVVKNKNRAPVFDI